MIKITKIDQKGRIDQRRPKITKNGKIRKILTSKNEYELHMNNRTALKN